MNDTQVQIFARALAAALFSSNTAGKPLGHLYAVRQSLEKSARLLALILTRIDTILEEQHEEQHMKGRGRYTANDWAGIADTRKP